MAPLGRKALKPQRTAFRGLLCGRVSEVLIVAIRRPDAWQVTGRLELIVSSLITQPVAATLTFNVENIGPINFDRIKRPVSAPVHQPIG